jgi:ribosomal protein S18 acetylase RimI-like enzyme
MITIKNITDLAQVYDYQLRFPAPFFFPTSFESWLRSFTQDVDGEGRLLFRNLDVKAAFDDNTLVGFVQYGSTAFGFDAQGEISSEVSYPVIRSLYFDEGREDAGQLLLQAATETFPCCDRVYAFFHYFGMSCFARHGKLFEGFPWIGALLRQNGFQVEHENVYYSATLTEQTDSAVRLREQGLTAGNQQTFDFLLEGRQVGGCEVHYVDLKGVAYLRWIYVNGELQSRGIGTKCMQALKAFLHEKGYVRLDTDTALNNAVAQRFYEKNGFARAGITRSFYRDR